MEQILTSNDANQFLRPKFALYVEELRVIALGSNKTIINHECTFKGTSDACLIHPRDILRFAIVNCASSIIISHNHPFGSSTPSLEDIKITLRIFKAARLLQIQLLDHIIIGQNGYFSFADQKLLGRTLKGIGTKGFGVDLQLNSIS